MERDADDLIELAGRLRDLEVEDAPRLLAAEASYLDEILFAAADAARKQKAVPGRDDEAALLEAAAVEALRFRTYGR